MEALKIPPTVNAQKSRTTAANNAGFGVKSVPKDNKPLVGRMRFKYKNPIADAYFSYLLAFGARGGADMAETFASISDVGQFDTQAWVQKLTEMARRVEDRAQDCLSRGHTISAREAFLRAYFYDRAALFNLSPVKFTERYNKIRKRSVQNFRNSIALMSPMPEPLEIAYEGKKLPGYFIKCAADDRPRPTLYLVGGGESFCEDMCMLFGLGDAERGYNIVTVDLPGMGNTAADGLYMMPDVEKPISLVLDYIVSRKDVDSEKLALFGPSFGGYSATRAAVHDKRVKALIVNSIILNLNEYLVQAKELETLARFEKTPGFKMVTRIFGSWLAGLFNVMDVYKWRWNVDSIRGWLDACKAFRVDPSGIECPVLLMVGEDELAYEHTRRFHEIALREIKHPIKEMVIGKAEDGASGKNMLPNLTVIRQIVFDWLDEQFADSSNTASES